MSSERQLFAWRELDLGPQWVRRQAPPPAALVRLQAPHLPDSQRPAADRGESQDSWEQVADEVAGCVRCGLCETRRHTVFGSGPQAAKWLVIGEAPGADEDASGEPFVGKAGRLLDQMLAAIGLSRGEVFVTNVLKCRPPGNRDPAPLEAQTCSGYLYRQIDLVQPELILLLGAAAVHSVLKTKAGLAGLRGRVHGYVAAHGEIPVVCTYHPAYLLRNLPEKRKSWEDLCFAVDVATRQQALRVATEAGG